MMTGNDLSSARRGEFRGTILDKGPMKRRKRSVFGKDKRRKHRHWQVTVFYEDGEKFARVYIDREKALRFADRQKKSPVVRSARVQEIG